MKCCSCGDASAGAMGFACVLVTAPAARSRDPRYALALLLLRARASLSLSLSAHSHSLSPSCALALLSLALLKLRVSATRLAVSAYIPKCFVFTRLTNLARSVRHPEFPCRRWRGTLWGLHAGHYKLRAVAGAWLRPVQTVSLKRKSQRRLERTARSLRFLRKIQQGVERLRAH